jgi:hypothetical protein
LDDVRSIGSIKRALYYCLDTHPYFSLVASGWELTLGGYVVLRALFIGFGPSVAKARPGEFAYSFDGPGLEPPRYIPS